MLWAYELPLKTEEPCFVGRLKRNEYSYFRNCQNHREKAIHSGTNYLFNGSYL